MLGPTLKRLSASPLSVLLLVTLLQLQVTVTVVSGQGEDATPGQCKCVPYYLCSNNTFVTSGKGLIDQRFGGGFKCPSILEVCCNESAILKEPQEKDKIIDKMIWEVFPTPKPRKLSLDMCKCVPYYLCENGTIVTSGKGLIDLRVGGGFKCPGILEVCCNESIKSKKTPETDMARRNIDKKIWKSFRTTPHPPPPSDRCTCVPHHLCRNQTINVAPKQLITEMGINKDRCPNPMDVCCYDPIKSTKSSEIPENRTICGHWNPRGVKFTMTGDSHNEAQFGEFPWMIAILKLESNQSTTYICGGSLIHPKVVLTAVHCVIGKKPNELVIRAGEWDSQTDNEQIPIQDRQALKIINHEDFEPDELLNDIALIIVTKPFSLREHVGTTCLPSPNYVFSEQRCYASGWGKNVFGKLGVNKAILKKIDLPIVSRISCLELLRKTRLGDHYILPKSFMCAGGEIGKDTCQGDGGSPLTCPIKNRPKQFQQAGIVAWGIGCGNETPGVYVDVALFKNWIDKQMARENLDTRYYDPDYVPTN
ncbi:hypothetical protein QTP88_015406 [Uroleucon formosanum]